MDTLLPVVLLLVVLNAAVVRTACFEEMNDWLLEGLHGLESARLAAAVACEKRGRRYDTYFRVLLFRPKDRHGGCGIHLVWCLFGRFGGSDGRKMLQFPIPSSGQLFTQTGAAAEWQGTEGQAGTRDLRLTGHGSTSVWWFSGAILIDIRQLHASWAVGGLG